MAKPYDWLHNHPKCPECGQNMNPQFGEIKYDFDTFQIVVSDVPLSVCDSCGYRVIPGPVSVEIDDVVREAAASFRPLGPRHSHVELDTLTFSYRGSEEDALAFA